MKKNLFQLFAVVLSVCMILSACSFVDLGRDFDEDADKGGSKVEKPLTDEELIVGQWKATVECGDYFSDVMAESAGEELADYFDFTGIGFDITLSFDGDDNFTLALDEDSLEAFAEDVLDAMMDGLHTYMEEALSSVLGGQSLDEYLAANGMDFDQLMVSSGLDADSLTEEMLSGFDSANNEGKYSFEDGKLNLDGDIHTYVLEKDRLTLEAPEGVEDEMMDVLFPMELEKID